jgi:hypothetical protein
MSSSISGDSPNGRCTPPNAVALISSIVQSSVFARREIMTTFSVVCIVHGITLLLLSLAYSSSWIAAPILPSCPPSLFPLRAVKSILAQLLVHRIMCFTHPCAKLASAGNSRCILGHPALEVLCADPTWVELAECREKRLGLGLQLRRGLRGVGSGDAV